MIGEAGRADAGAFLARLIQLDPTAVVRLRPVGPGSVGQGSVGQGSVGQGSVGQGSVGQGSVGQGSAQIWARLPFGVLVVRTLSASVPGDTTVAAADLLASLREEGGRPARRDTAWRWALPPSAGRLVETIPAAEVIRVAEAASRTLREAATGGVGGRAVGERVVRDALLDHVPIVVTGTDGVRVEVSQRLVQAVVRMGFLGTAPRDPEAEKVTLGEGLVAVRTVGAWIGLACSYGSAWYRPSSPLHLARGVDVDTPPFR
jgi:hypothetical protein